MKGALQPIAVIDFATVRFGLNPQRHVMKRLRGLRADLLLVRQELVLAEQQYAVLSEDDDDQRIRMLVSENRFDEKQWDHAHRHAEVMLRSIATARRRVADLERAESELLEQLVYGTDHK